MDAAFWKSGWFGHDHPQMKKMFRSALLLTDRIGFQVANDLVDHDAGSFETPETIATRDVSAHFGINRKTKLLSYQINFPLGDTDANVLELSNSYIPLSDR